MNTYRLTGDRGGEDHEVRFRQHLVQGVRSLDRIGELPPSLGMAPDPDHPHVERLGPPRDRGADHAQANDREGTSFQRHPGVVGMPGRLPMTLLHPLVTLGDPPGDPEHQGHRLLGHRDRIGAADVAHLNGAPAEHVEVELVAARVQPGERPETGSRRPGLRGAPPSPGTPPPRGKAPQRRHGSPRTGSCRAWLGPRRYSRPAIRRGPGRSRPRSRQR